MGAGSIKSVAFSHGSRLLASSSADYTVRLHDLTKDQQQPKPEKENTGLVHFVTFSPDGCLLASGSWGIIQIWDTATGTVRQRFKGRFNNVGSLAFSPDGKLLACTTTFCENSVDLFDHFTDTFLHKIEGPPESVESVVFSPDGSLLAAGFQGGIVQLGDLATGMRQVTLEHLDSVNSVVFSPNGRLLASASRDQTVRLWDPKQASCSRNLSI